LAQLHLKRRQWTEGEKVLDQLGDLISSTMAAASTSNDSTQLLLMAEFKTRHGDLKREFARCYAAAKDYYSEAEAQLAKLTESSFVEAVENAYIADHSFVNFLFSSYIDES
jgi:hypothetical protein